MLVKANERRVLLRGLHVVRLVVQMQLVALMGLRDEVLLVTSEVPEVLFILTLPEFPIGWSTWKHYTWMHCRVLTSRHENVVLLLLSALLGALLFVTHTFQRVFPDSHIVLLLSRDHVLLGLYRYAFLLTRQEKHWLTGWLLRLWVRLDLWWIVAANRIFKCMAALHFTRVLLHDWLRLSLLLVDLLETYQFDQACSLQILVCFLRWSSIVLLNIRFLIQCLWIHWCWLGLHRLLAFCCSMSAFSFSPGCGLGPRIYHFFT